MSRNRIKIEVFHAISELLGTFQATTRYICNHLRTIIKNMLSYYKQYALETVNHTNTQPVSMVGDPLLQVHPLPQCHSQQWHDGTGHQTVATEAVDSRIERNNDCVSSRNYAMFYEQIDPYQERYADSTCRLPKYSN